MKRALVFSLWLATIAACAHPTGEASGDPDTANEGVHSKGGSGGAAGHGGSAGQAGQKPTGAAGSAGKPPLGGSGPGENAGGANDAGDSAVGTNGGDAGQTEPDPVTTPGELSLHYQAGNTDPNDNQVDPHLRIVSQAPQAVELSTLSARYYFSSEPAPPLFVEIYNAAAEGTSGYRALASGSVVATTKDGYAELAFTAAAGVLDPGGKVTIELAIHDTGWSGKFDENNDYSYDAAHTAYSASNHVTLYESGKLVSGIEPP